MVDLPFMMMNWSRFFSDAKVAVMPTEAQGIYALVLGRMWLNQGWLKADDKVIARMIGLDVRAWRSRFKPHIVPLLRRQIDPHVGDIYVQKHLQEVRAAALASVEKTQASTARARAAKAAKHGKTPSEPEPKKAPATEPVSEPAAAPVSGSTSGVKPQPQQKRALPLTGREPFSVAPSSPDLGALPPRVNGHVERSARTGSPSLKGGSPTAPSEALLKSRLVQAPLDDDEDEPKRPSAVGLFGALEAAIRQGKPEED
jgi:uncharacterized protein YdaU (DUF1376 family)